MRGWPIPYTQMKNNFAQRGIAIGPILMVVALLAILGGLFSSGMSSFGGNATIDRIRTDLRGQANLIRSKIQECYMVTMGNQGFGWPIGAGIQVRNLLCPGDPSGTQNLWSGRRPASLPPVVPGFNEWVYHNYAQGRCISATPTALTATGPMADGLRALAGLFNANEVHLDQAGDWTISIWMTPLVTTRKCGT